MLKKTIKYVDYDGTEREETFYFNLSEAEIMEMQMGTTGGLAEMIERIVEAQDAPSIMKTFKDIILKSYGVKSPDGRRIIKSDALREEFSQTEAYSKLFIELATDADAAAKFINAIVPNQVGGQPVPKATPQIAAVPNATETTN